MIVAVTKENRIIGFAQADEQQSDEQQSEERVDQRPAGKLIQHTLVTKEKRKKSKKICGILDAGS